MNFKKLLFLSALILSVSCSKDLDDRLGLRQDYQEINAIPADSDLFDNLKEVASDSDNQNETIACIDFIYPITLFVFNENDEYQSTSTISDDDEFSNFLAPIPETYSISISFPIRSTLNTGEEFEINDKEELEESISNCLDIEMVGECEGLIRECLWKVGYSFEYDNPYLGNILQESDGFLTFNYGDDILPGSWTPFVIESELHININLIDTTAVGQFFNFDWKAEYIDQNSLRLFYEDKELILNQRCDLDFNICKDFKFESCETELDSGVAEFLLGEYSFCIFDTLDYDQEQDNLTITYYESEEDALLMTNPILPDEPYLTNEEIQIIYVRINDLESGEHFIVEIELIAESC
ncbi:hypothetical protein [Winogradskyella tangerina]|uniref:hypothetical protein n=1 Tax=Winogradskyella tangerina TaxID=2023240 RepID=UPI000DBE94BF|nr:hypothetical protein [Winogradskyella tangerina]